MKLGSLLGTLFIIATPLFAAEEPAAGAITPNACKGKKKIVDECAGEPCTYEIRKGIVDTMHTGKW